MAKIQAPRLSSLIALLAALPSTISACSAPSPAPSAPGAPADPVEPIGAVEPDRAKPPDSRSAVLFLIALDGQPSWQKAREVPGAEIVGCNDYLVPVTVNLNGESPEARAEAALNKLFSFTENDLAELGYQSGFSPSALQATAARAADGSLAVNLKGTLTVTGVCAVPRMKSQIERTLSQFGRVSISVNGSESEWRCLGDESGRCN
ncbi:MAG: hypothetical protein HUU21_09435 [Polyangiaceae bacterium]|nr:hypothetical protein [Polyangiaceae bacterium]